MAQERTGQLVQLGREVFTARTRRELTHRALGRLVGCSHSLISLIESGKPANRDPAVITKLAEALGVAPEHWLRLAGYSYMGGMWHRFDHAPPPPMDAVRDGLRRGAWSPVAAAAIETLLVELLDTRDAYWRERYNECVAELLQSGVSFEQPSGVEAPLDQQAQVFEVLRNLLFQSERHQDPRRSPETRQQNNSHSHTTV